MKFNIKEIKENLIEWVKRPQVWGFFVSVAVLFVISFAFFYPDASQGRVLHQNDMMQGAANGQEIKDYMEQTGEKSWWTNSLMSGMPAFQIAPSYTSNSLFSWINDLYGLGLPVPSDLLFTMMFGFLILLFAMRVRWYFSLIGAIAFGFSTYFIIIIGAGHIWKFVTLSYIPPTIAGIVLCYRGKYLLGGALAALFAMMQIASNHVQMSYYFMFVIVGLVITYLVMAVKEKKLKQWCIATGVLLASASLAVGANLPSLYHTYKYSKETIRGTYTELTSAEAEKSAEASSSGVSRGYMTQYSYGKSETLSLLIPDINGGASHLLGELEEVENYAKNNFEPEDQIVSQFLPYYTQYFGGDEGTSGPVYVGAIIFVLFLLGFFVIKKPIALTLFILTSLSVLLALGRNFMWFTDLFADYLPMYESFRAVESILVIAEFTIPLLAVLALQKLFTTENVWVKHKVAIISVFATTMVVCLIIAIVPDIFGSTIGGRDTEMTNRIVEEALKPNGLSDVQITAVTAKLHNEINALRYSMVSADAWRSFWFIAAALGALLLYFYRKIPMWMSCSIIGVLVLGDLYSVNKRYVNHDSFHDEPMEVIFTPQEIDKEIYRQAEARGLGENYRVVNLDNFGSHRESYFHKSVGGYHAAKLTRYNDLISHGMNGNVLSMLNTCFVIQNGKLLPNFGLGNAWFVGEISYVDNADDEMAALSVIDPAVEAVADAKFKQILGSDIPAVSEGDEIVETSYAPNKLTYKAKSVNGGLAVFSEIYFPWGWEATIDGKPIEIGRVNYVLRAIRVPAGEHEIVMTFKPKSVETTETIATISVIIIYITLVAAIGFALVSLRKKEEEEIKK